MYYNEAIHLFLFCQKKFIYCLQNILVIRRHYLTTLVELFIVSPKLILFFFFDLFLIFVFFVSLFVSANSNFLFHIVFFYSFYLNVFFFFFLLLLFSMLKTAVHKYVKTCPTAIFVSLVTSYAVFFSKYQCQPFATVAWFWV